jgi:hypothetical protein
VKLRSDESGNQTTVPFDDVIDVGALDADGVALTVEKRRLKDGETELTFVAPKRPALVGIDPLNKLIDRNSSDNVMAPTVK